MPDMQMKRLCVRVNWADDSFIEPGLYVWLFNKNIRVFPKVLIDKIKVWFTNAMTFHHRAMMNYLRKRGWVVFYLEEQHRECRKDHCWLKLYREEEKRVGVQPTKPWPRG